MWKKYKKWLIAGLIIIAILVVWFLARGKGAKEEYSTIVAKAGPLTQTVSEVGVVKPVQELALNFLSVGRVSELMVKVGDKVLADTPLMSLDSEALELKKLEAEAGVRIAQANLSKLLSGASFESLNVSYKEIEQARSAEQSARTDLEQVKKTVAESIAQAKKNLSDLQSDLPNTSTPQEEAVASAQIALENTKKSGESAVLNAKNSLMLALSDKVLVGEVALDNLKTILDDEDGENVLGVKNTGSLSATKKSRIDALNMLDSVKSAIAQARKSGNNYDIDQAVTLSKDYLAKVSLSLSNAFAMLEATITSANYPQSKLDANKNLVIAQSSQVNLAANTVESSAQVYSNAQVNYNNSLASAKQSLNQAQVSLNNAITGAQNALSNAELSGRQQIINAEARLSNASNAVTVAQARLNNVSAPARSQDVTLAQAQVSQAQAALDNINNQLDNAIIKAPLDGIITEVNYKVGEQTGSSAKPAVKMLAEGNFEIEVDISESDINKISLGDKVEITLDALADELVIDGEVSFIEPAQTLIQGVVYYKVKIAFADINEIQTNLASHGSSLKSGMTANVTITTQEKNKVIAIPARAIIEDGLNKKVRILKNGVVVEVNVTSGLRGDDGQVEIKEGLEEGDEVITFIKTL